MIRSRYSKRGLLVLFRDLKAHSQKSWDELARELEVDKRTLFDWRKGRHRIPTHVTGFIASKYGCRIPASLEQTDDALERKNAARKGGIARQLIHGNPGTFEGRRRGGKNSIKAQRAMGNGFFVRKPVANPALSTELAEFIGIVLGDGGISTRQVAITLHKTDDKDYALFVKGLAEKLFRTNVALRDRSDAHVTQVVISSTSIVDILLGMGLVTGSKVRKQVDVPSWIKEDNDFSKACARGLVDTDGCIFIDKHSLSNGTLYRNIGLAFTNRSKPLLRFFESLLLALGLNPTRSGSWNVLLRRKSEIEAYMRLIGSSNLKNRRKFDRFIKRSSRRGVRVVE